MEVCWKVSAVLWIISLCTEDQSFITEATTLPLFHSYLTQTWCCTSSTLEHVAPNWRLVAWLYVCQCVGVCLHWRVAEGRPVMLWLYIALLSLVPNMDRLVDARLDRRATLTARKIQPITFFITKNSSIRFTSWFLTGGGSTWLALWNCVSWLRTDVGQM